MTTDPGDVTCGTCGRVIGHGEPARWIGNGTGTYYHDYPCTADEAGDE